MQKLSGEKPHFIMTLPEQLKEERRLAYVAATRAVRGLTICYTDESQVSELVLPSPFIEEMLGRDVKAAAGENERHSLADTTMTLAAALNKQDIESVLRTRMRSLRLVEKTSAELFAFLESIGLDAYFICEEFPFEREPSRSPDLTGHTYSASQLNTYLACPRRFFFEKILRIAPERPEDFGLGQLIHLVLEKFHNRVKTFGGDEATLEAGMREAFLTIWKGGSTGGSGRDAFCHTYPTVLQRATIERRATDILKRYLKTEIKQASDKEIVACEKRIDFVVRDCPFTARIDRLDAAADGHHVIDYKTAATGPKGAITIKKKFLNVDGKPDYRLEDFQMPLYLLACRRAGYNPAELVYYWLAQQDAQGMFKQSSLRVGEGEPDLLSSKDMEAVEQSIVDIVGRIASGNFDPSPKSSFDCRRCSFDFICTAAEESEPDEG